MRNLIERKFLVFGTPINKNEALFLIEKNGLGVYGFNTDNDIIHYRLCEIEQNKSIYMKVMIELNNFRANVDRGTINNMGCTHNQIMNGMGGNSTQMQPMFINPTNQMQPNINIHNPMNGFAPNIGMNRQMMSGNFLTPQPNGIVNQNYNLIGNENFGKIDEPMVDISVVQDIIELAKDAGAKEITMKFEDLAKLLIEASSGRLDVGIDKGFNMNSDIMFSNTNQFIQPMAPTTQGMGVVQAMQPSFNTSQMMDIRLSVIFLDDNLSVRFFTPLENMRSRKEIFKDMNMELSFVEFENGMKMIERAMMKIDKTLIHVTFRQGDVFIKGKDMLKVVGDVNTLGSNNYKLIYFNPDKHSVPVVIDLKNNVSLDCGVAMMNSDLLDTLNENKFLYEEWLGDNISVKPRSSDVNPELYLSYPGIYDIDIKGFGYYVIGLLLAKEISKVSSFDDYTILHIGTQNYNLVHNDSTTLVDASMAITKVNGNYNIKLNKNLLEVISR